MAITKSLNTSQGIPCPNAYITISNMSYDKFPPPSMTPNQTAPTTTVVASIFYDQAARTANSGVIDKVTFSFNVDTSTAALSVYAQAYSALKALRSMAGAVDC